MYRDFSHAHFSTVGRRWLLFISALPGDVTPRARWRIITTDARAFSARDGVIQNCFGIEKKNTGNIITFIKRVPLHKKKRKKKGMVLYSAVSSPLDRSKRFTLSSPGRPVHSDTVLGFSWKHSSHAAIAQRLFNHISTTVYSQVGETGAN